MARFVLNLLRGTHEVLLGYRPIDHLATREHLLFGNREMAGDIYRAAGDLQTSVTARRNRSEQMELTLHGK
jgi:hypothetical protein